MDIYISYEVITLRYPVPIWHHRVITLLFTVFPLLYFTSPWLFCNYQSVLLNPFTFFTQPPSYMVTINLFTVSMSWFLFSLLILFFRLHIQVKSFVFLCPGWMLQMRVCVGPLRGHPCLQQTAISPWQTESPLIFTAMYYVGASSWLWCSELGSTRGWDPTILRGNLCSWDTPPEFQPSPRRVGPAILMSLPFLPALVWLLL